MECDGQTGYTMHIVDDAVTNVLHQIFDRMNSASDNVLLGCAEDRQVIKLRADLKKAKAENTKATTEYESLKAEMVKVVMGKSEMPRDVLTELVNESCLVI